jgi:hypothetical protein
LTFTFSVGLSMVAYQGFRQMSGENYHLFAVFLGSMLVFPAQIPLCAIILAYAVARLATRVKVMICVFALLPCFLTAGLFLVSTVDQIQVPLRHWLAGGQINRRAEMWV